MVRIKTGYIRKDKHKKLLNQTKGFRGRASSCYRLGLPRVYKSLQYKYRSRKLMKRRLNEQFITKINAAIRELDNFKGYNQFYYHLNQQNCMINRKILATLSISEPISFKYLSKIY